MLKSILNATGIIQNLERVKSELEQEANIQLESAKTISEHIAVISVWALVAVIVGILAVIVAICLIYAWLAPTYGSVAALAMLFLLLALFFLIAAVVVRSKYAQIPARPSLKLPRILEPSVPGAAAERPSVASWSNSRRTDDPASSSNIAADPLFNWLFSVAREAAPSGNTGNQQVDQLFTTLKPQAEAVASEAVNIAVERLRHGDRKTMIAILGAAAFVGWMASRQSKPIRK
jgi:hypothetical protein